MMNAVVKPYHEMCLNSSELIVPRDTYQRALHPARVAASQKNLTSGLPMSLRSASGMVTTM